MLGRSLGQQQRPHPQAPGSSRRRHSSALRPASKDPPLDINLPDTVIPPAVQPGAPAPTPAPPADPAALLDPTSDLVTLRSPQTPAPQPLQQHQHQGGGYLIPGLNDGWTWDEDYAGLKQKGPQRRQQQLVPGSPRQAAVEARRKAAAASHTPTVITRLPEHLSRSVINNGVLLLDKPQQWSATDCVVAVKNALKAKRVGHVGPLDANATGLVILLLGDATRLSNSFHPLTRTYTGTITLGTATTTYDSTGDAMEELPWQGVTDAAILAVAEDFTGEIEQQVPLWSKTKVKGRPLGWYAQRGLGEEAVGGRPSRAVVVQELQLWREGGHTGSADLGADLLTGRSSSSSSAGGSGSRASSSGMGSRSGVGDAKQEDWGRVLGFRAVASKGASMRVLAHDLGKALGCGAHLSSLRREAIGEFTVDRAWVLEVLLPMAKKYAKGFRDFGGGGGGY